MLTQIKRISDFVGLSPTVLRWGTSESPKEKLSPGDRLHLEFLQKGGPEDLMRVLDRDWKIIYDLQKRPSAFNSWLALRLALSDLGQVGFGSGLERTLSLTQLPDLAMTSSEIRQAALDKLKNASLGQLHFWLKTSIPFSRGSQSVSLFEFAHRIYRADGPLTVEFLADQAVKGLTPIAVAQFLDYLYKDVVSALPIGEEIIQWGLEEIARGLEPTATDLINSGKKMDIPAVNVWSIIAELRRRGDISFSSLELNPVLHKNPGGLLASA